jgi:hypothetical protein
MTKKKQTALRQDIELWEAQLEPLKEAREALRTAISTSYGFGAPADFVDGMDETLRAIYDRVAVLERAIADAHRQLETVSR